jgi:tRNA-specific 2-thiouridylase
VDPVAFEHHLLSPQGRDRCPEGSERATVGGGSCCDTVSVALQIDGWRVTDAGFSAEGCGAAAAAGSAAVTLALGSDLLQAARIGPAEIAAELGGLSPAKLHAADVAAEALHRALGLAAMRRARLTSPGPDRSARTLVAMSGGVDSAVAALLCARRGPVIAVTLELWSDDEHDPTRSCCSAGAVARARALAHQMGLPHLTLDLREPFRAGVVAPYLAAHAAGETPNPCVRCNGEVRLDAMLELAARLGCARLATGHYARTREGLLRVAADRNKDQSYMLAALELDSLARISFPLGELTKPQVRAIAAEHGLPVADQPDSQDLCFLAGTDRARFLARHGAVAARRGEVVDQAGNVLAAHDGHERFTVGQRRGLGVHAGSPVYVLRTDADTNRVTVGPRAALLTERVRIRDARLHRPGARVDSVKLRYRSTPLPCSIQGEPEPGRHRSLQLHLGEPAVGPAPGQLACLMEGELVIGWGTIAR